MTTLREAAQQALEAMDELHRTGDTQVFDLCHRETTEALRAALAEPEDWELRRLREELERCKQTCAATSEAWREEAALAEMKPCNESCAPGYCYCECPHGVTDGNCKECYGKATSPLDWEPELMVRPKPLSIEQIEEAWDKSNFNGRPNIGFARAIERAHGIGG